MANGDGLGQGDGDDHVCYDGDVGQHLEVPSKNVRRRILSQEFRNITNVFQEKVEKEENK